MVYVKEDYFFKVQAVCLALEDRTDRWCQNVGKKLAIYAVQNPKRDKISNTNIFNFKLIRVYRVPKASKFFRLFYFFRLSHYSSNSFHVKKKKFAFSKIFICLLQTKFLLQGMVLGHYIRSRVKKFPA